MNEWRGDRSAPLVNKCSFECRWHRYTVHKRTDGGWLVRAAKLVQSHNRHNIAVYRLCAAVFTVDRLCWCISLVQTRCTHVVSMYITAYTPNVVHKPHCVIVVTNLSWCYLGIFFVYVYIVCVMFACCDGELLKSVVDTVLLCTVTALPAALCVSTPWVKKTGPFHFSITLASAVRF